MVFEGHVLPVTWPAPNRLALRPHVHTAAVECDRGQRGPLSTHRKRPSRPPRRRESRWHRVVLCITAKKPAADVLLGSIASAARRDLSADRQIADVARIAM